MTYANIGTLGTLPGLRDEVVAALTRRSYLLSDLGCTMYEVGVHGEEPDTVFVVELWTSKDDHRRSLEHPEVQAAIAAARPMLSGRVSGFGFDVVGSPLRDA